MSDKGFIMLDRVMQDNRLWLSEAFTRSQAWIDLLFLANWKPATFYIRGNKIDVRRGELAWSVLNLSKRWKWSRQKVSGFLDMLENEHQIKHQKTTVTTLIYITNYDKYQDKRTSEPTTERQQNDNRKTHKKKLKNLKNLKDIVPYDEIVEIYHEVLINLPGIRELTPKRKTYIKNIWESEGGESEARNNIGWWNKYFEFVKTCPHLMGENNRGWTANLQWITKPENFIKIIEGNYK